MVSTAEHTHPDVDFNTSTAYHGMLLQHCQTILGRLHWPSERGPRTLGVTSCLSGEGVSTVAAHLAATAAACGNGPILLVDTNQLRPAVHQRFGTPAGPGLLPLLPSPDLWRECVRPTAVTALSVLAAGAADPESAHAYAPEAFCRLLEQFSSHFRLVLFDMPPASPVGWTQQLACRLDGILFVVESERVRYEVAQRRLEDFQAAGAKVLGAVLNKRPQHIPTWLYQKL